MASIPVPDLADRFDDRRDEGASARRRGAPPRAGARGRRGSTTRLVVVALAVVGATACAADDAATGSDAPRSAIITTAGRSGGIQGVLDDWTAAGDAVTLYASGAAGPDGRNPQGTDQLRVGSISKTFVATMLLQLVDGGALNLDELVTRYAPALTGADGVTVRQLLGHASGLPEHVDQAFLDQLLGDMDRTWTPDEVLALVADRPRDFAPGERHAYSNTNYIVAGLLLEAITGTSLADNLRTRIVEPLGLTDTYFAPEASREPVAGFSADLPGGDTSGSSYRAVETAAGAAGALVSSAGDLATFLAALTDGRLVSPGAFEEMTRDVETEEFGLGIVSSSPASGTAFGHDGAIPGFASFMAIDPEAGDVVVVLANDDSRSPGDLATRIMSSDD